ncbi:MAG: BspA family leucine-rich repeat surface protein, partial [Eubacteriales bacterium]|nr:BspA family leucine-rich repeat surface protein [Eubacteriales bacterium]
MNKKNLRRTMTGLIAALVLIMQIPVGGVTLEKADSQSMRMQGTAVRVQAAESAFPETPSEGQSVWTGTAEEFEETAGYAETAQEAAEYAEIPEDYEETAGYAETAQEAAEYAEIPEDDEETAGFAETGEEAAAPEEAPEDYEENAGLAEKEEDAAEPEELVEDGEETAGTDEVSEDEEEAAEPEQALEDGEKAAGPEIITEDGEEAAEPEKTAEDAAASGETAAGNGASAEEAVPSQEPGEEFVLEEFPDGLEEIASEEEAYAEPAVNGVYAVIYSDGRMVFQVGPATEAGAGVVTQYPVEMEGNYDLHSDEIPNTPWYEKKDLVTKVDFKDSIAPKAVDYWFMGFSNLEEITNLSNLDVSRVTTMRGMFQGCAKLKELVLIENNKGIWDTSNVTDMRRMFFGCTSLRKLDLSTLNTSSVTELEETFTDCTGLTELSLIRWDVSSVTNLKGLLRGCANLKEVDLSSWNTSNVGDMSEMFSGCGDLQVIHASGNFDTGNVSVSGSMFLGCFALKGSSGTVYSEDHLNAEYARIDMPGDPGYFSQGVYAILYEDGVMAFQYGDTPDGRSGVYKIYPVDMIDGYAMTGRRETNVPWEESVDLVKMVVIVDRIAPRDVSLWFYQFHNMESVRNPENLDLSRAVRMIDLFFGCESLKSIDMSTWDTSGITSVHGVFYDCKSLKKLDVTTWDTSKMGDMSALFRNCENLEEVDVSGFDVSSTYHFGSVFRECRKLTNIDVSSWDTSGGQVFGGMFSGCTGLTELDLSGWDTSASVQFQEQFRDCVNLKTILASDRFVTTSLGRDDLDDDMFTGCTALVGGYGTPYDPNYTDSTYARIDTADTPGYFTKKSYEIRVTSSFTKNASPSQDQTFPLNAGVNGGAKLTYKSDQTGVTVSNDGNVTIKKGFAGSAEITVSAAETGCYRSAEAKVTVTVKKLANTISVTKSITKNASPSQNQTFPLNAGVNGGA